MKVTLTRNLGRNLADMLGKDVKELKAGSQHDLPRPQAMELAKAGLIEEVEGEPEPPKAEVKAVPKADSKPEAKEEPKQAAKPATKPRSK